MAQGKRYKWQGSVFAVQTGFAAAKTITGVTRANPGVVSSAAHGLSAGAVGAIAGLTGMTELNGGLYVVANPAAGTFELSGTDTSAYGAYVSGGTFTPATFSPFCELKDVDQQDGTADQIDVTTICSTSKEFEVGLSDSGTLNLDYNYAGAETVQAALTAAKRSGAVLAFKVTLPNNGGTLVMMGSVQSQSISGGNGGVWTSSASIKLTGPVYVL